jgi:hypothetical protein
MLSEATIHKAGRIDQIVRDYFTSNPSTKEVPAKDLMLLFVEKGIFNKDYSRPGLPIRNLLRELDKEGKLTLLKNCKVIRNEVNRNWYFSRNELKR